MSNIISVGYTFDVDSIKEDLFKLLDIDDTSKTEFKTKIYAGVFYGGSCKGGLKTAKKSHQELLDWYKQREGKTIIVNISVLYINKKKTVLGAEIRTSGVNFYCFLYNKNGVGTTVQKKQLQQEQFFTKIDLTNTKDPSVSTLKLQPFKLEGTAYIHETKKM